MFVERWAQLLAGLVTACGERLVPPLLVGLEAWPWPLLEVVALEWPPLEMTLANVATALEVVPRRWA